MVWEQGDEQRWDQGDNFNTVLQHLVGTDRSTNHGKQTNKQTKKRVAKEMRGTESHDLRARLSIPTYKLCVFHRCKKKKNNYATFWQAQIPRNKVIVNWNPRTQCTVISMSWYYSSAMGFWVVYPLENAFRMELCAEKLALQKVMWHLLGHLWMGSVWFMGPWCASQYSRILMWWVLVVTSTCRTSCKHLKALISADKTSYAGSNSQ